MIILENMSCETRKHMLSMLIDPMNLKGFVSHYGFQLMHMVHNNQKALTEKSPNTSEQQNVGIDRKIDVL